MADEAKAIGAVFNENASILCLFLLSESGSCAQSTRFGGQLGEALVLGAGSTQSVGSWSERGRHDICRYSNVLIETFKDWK